MLKGHRLAPLGIALLALSLAPAGAATVTATYEGIFASITAPDAIDADTDFEVTVEGILAGGGAFDASAYRLYLGASWMYDSNHMVDADGGTLIDASGFNWGNHTESYTLNLPADTHVLTYVFGDRRGGHGWYDVAVDLEVTVRPAGPEVCGAAWRPPLTDAARSGRTIPLKFVAYDCGTGALYEDTSVSITVVDETGDVVDAASCKGNPHTGIDLAGSQYHHNWDTAGLAAGRYSVGVAFDGFVIDAFARTFELTAGGGRGARGK